LRRDIIDKRFTRFLKRILQIKYFEQYNAINSKIEFHSVRRFALDLIDQFKHFKLTNSMLEEDLTHILYFFLNAKEAKKEKRFKRTNIGRRVVTIYS